MHSRALFSFVQIALIFYIFESWAAGVDDVQRCPPHVARNLYLHTYSDRCYQFILTQKKKWDDANSHCTQQGGYLITIEREDIQKFVEQTITDVTLAGSTLWIGATDKVKEQDWKWVTGERVSVGYSNWKKPPSCELGENLCHEDCACLLLEEGYKWHPTFCSANDRQYGFICQYNMITTTTSTTSTSTTAMQTTTAATSTTTTTEATRSKNNTTENIPISDDEDDIPESNNVSTTYTSINVNHETCSPCKDYTYLERFANGLAAFVALAEIGFVIIIILLCLRQNRRLCQRNIRLLLRKRLKNEANTIAALQTYLIHLYACAGHWKNPLTGDEINTPWKYVKPIIKLVSQRDHNSGKLLIQQMQDENQSMLLSYVKVFKTNTKQCQNIYVTGNAGVGKTLFCNQLVKTWCKAIQNIAEEGFSADDMRVLKGFRLLFYVDLRTVESHYHIEEMIKNKLLHNAPLEYNVYDILKTERCLVVLDGLDEWSCQPTSNLCRGLNKHIPGRNTINENCTYLTTTRKWKFAVINVDPKECDKHIELCGFDESSSKELANNMVSLLQCHADTSYKIDDFFEEVQKKRLNSLTKCPILLIYLVTLFYLRKDFGKSQVQLYSKILEVLFEHNERRKKNLGDTSSIVTIKQDATNLPGCFSQQDEVNCHTHKHLIICLSKLAFLSLFTNTKEDSQVFKQDQIELCGIDKPAIELCLKYGILTKDKVLNNSMEQFYKYSFLFKELQYFFAAVYFVTSKSKAAEAQKQDEDITETSKLQVAEGEKQDEDSMRQIREYCNELATTLQMEQMFKFVCGMNAELGNQLLKHLTSVVFSDKHVQASRQSLGGKELIKEIQTCVMACVAEGTSNGLAVDVHLQDLQDHVIDNSTISDYISHVVQKKSTCIKSVHIDTEGCKKEHVTAVLKHLQKVTSLEKLWLQDLRHIVSDSSILEPVLKSNVSTLKSLCLMNVDLVHQKAPFSAVLDCVATVRALQLVEDMKLDDQKVPIENKEKGMSHDQIIQLLAATTKLTQLDLRLVCSDHERDCTAVLDMSNFIQLQTLGLSQFICVTKLHAVALSIEKIDLSAVTVAHSTLRKFIEALAQTSNKVEVKLWDVTVTEDSGDPDDTAADLRNFEKFTVEECDIWLNKPWSRLKFHMK